MDSWTQIDIFTTTAGLEPLGAALSEAGFPAFAIRDAEDFEQFLAGKSGHWDYIEEELMRLREAETAITVYLPDNQRGKDGLLTIRDTLTRLKNMDADSEWGRLEYSLTGVNEEDWAFSWKKYYKPIKPGNRLVVCPSWENWESSPGEIVLLMDPGMAFGTGTHETTSLCLQLLEQVIEVGESILDIGCGSGILSLAAVLLGAGHATGVDIDEVAVRVARENAELNGIGNNCDFLHGDLAKSVSKDKKYDIVCANIVADVVLRFAPEVSGYLKPGGIFLVSGIIDDRAQEVLDGVTACGFLLKRRMDLGGWTALMFEASN